LDPRPLASYAPLVKRLAGDFNRNYAIYKAAQNNRDLVKPGNRNGAVVSE